MSSTQEWQSLLRPQHTNYVSGLVGRGDWTRNQSQFRHIKMGAYVEMQLGGDKMAVIA